MSSPSPASSTPFYCSHVPKNMLLILLSLITLPLSSTLVLASLLYTRFFPQPKPLPPRNGDAGRKTILVTGVSMTKGLAIARLLVQHTPHRIIGADISTVSPGRWSKAVEKYYKLVKPEGQDAEPYIDSLIQVMQQENVSLWISCSSVIAALEDAQVVDLATNILGPSFRAVQFREDAVERLHEKDQFIDYLRCLDLQVPESYRCTSAGEVLAVLAAEERRWNGGKKAGKRRKWIMKPIGVDDRARASMMTLLPFEGVQETRDYVKRLGVSSSNPFQLQRYIEGHEYCTHSLVIRGRVVAFAACPSSDLLMHYEALPMDSALTREMLTFTKKVAEDGGEGFSGHLSFDFLAEGEGDDVQLYPIECNPRAHTAVVLFSDTPHMAGAYLSAFSSDAELEGRQLVVPHTPTWSYYWFGHDLVTLFILPLLDLLRGTSDWEDLFGAWAEFSEHVVGWRDATFVDWDPVPFLVLYHVYWPLQFAACLVKGTRWSRVNVSTTKVFQS